MFYIHLGVTILKGNKLNHKHAVVTENTLKTVFGHVNRLKSLKCKCSCENIQIRDSLYNDDCCHIMLDTLALQCGSANPRITG